MTRSIYSNRKLAARAYALSKKGLKGRAIAAALNRAGVRAPEANTLASIGRRWAEFDRLPLTAAELALVRALAAIEREDLERGELSSTKGKWVSARCRKSAGWAASTVRKRLGRHRAGEHQSFRGTGLNLVTSSRNGHIWLEPAGWALVLATEAAEAAAQAAMRTPEGRA